MTAVTVAPAGPVHAPALALLHGEAFPEGWTAAAFARLLAMPGTAGFVACIEAGEPVGFIVCRQAANEAEILTIAVRPCWRRTGVARALFAAARAALPATVGEMFIEVAVSNEPGLALYQALGFEVVGRRSGYYATPTGPEDALVMRHQLRIA